MYTSAIPFRCGSSAIGFFLAQSSERKSTKPSERYFGLTDQATDVVTDVVTPLESFAGGAVLVLHPQRNRHHHPEHDIDDHCDVSDKVRSANGLVSAERRL